MLMERIQQRLTDSTHQHLKRVRHVIDRQMTNEILTNKKKLINFCSNDYLALSTDSAVKKSFMDGAEKYGLGSGSSAQVSGYHQPHQQLEEAFAGFFNRERALVMNSGYHANLAVLTALADKNSTVIADKHSHASLIDGLQLSQATYYRFRHQDLAHAEMLLKKNPDSFLITEGVFSIDGSLTDLKSLANLAKNYQSLLIVDDAHGVGWLGETGKGSLEYHQLTPEDVLGLITPLGKAFGGFGAVVSGNAVFIEALLQFGRTYRYTTALPPAIAHATLTLLNMIKTDTWRRATLKSLIAFFITEAKKRALPLLNEDPTPIKSFLVTHEKMATDLQEKLWQAGYFVAAIRPPTVSKKLSCIRVSLNCLHTEKQILHLLDILAENYEN